MPAKNPRINVVFEPVLYNAVRTFAIRDGMSLSLKVRDMVREAVEIMEDEFWDAAAEKNYKKYLKTKKAVSHNNFWKKK